MPKQKKKRLDTLRSCINYRGVNNIKVKNLAVATPYHSSPPCSLPSTWACSSLYLTYITLPTRSVSEKGMNGRLGSTLLVVSGHAVRVDKCPGCLPGDGQQHLVEHDLQIRLCVPWWHLDLLILPQFLGFVVSRGQLKMDQIRSGLATIAIASNYNVSWALAIFIRN